MPPMQVTGRCHCGNISFVLQWRPEPVLIPARACSCSFCLKHAGLWTTCPAGSLRVEVRDASWHATYAFGTRTAEFHLCTRCGIVPVVTSRIDARLHAVVSVRALEDVDPSLIQPAGSASFDDEAEAERLARRQKNWIADVHFTGLPA